MSLLSDLGNWLRNGADDIGSFVTNQPAHSPAQQIQPAQPPQPQQVQAKGPTLIIKNPGSNPLAASQPSQKGLPVNSTQPPQPQQPNLQANSLTQPNPLQTKPSFTPSAGAKGMASIKINAPQNNSWNVNRVVHDVTHNPVTNVGGALLHSIGESAAVPYTASKGLADQALGNQTAAHNAAQQAQSQYNQSMLAGIANPVGRLFNTVNVAANQDLPSKMTGAGNFGDQLHQFYTKQATDAGLSPQGANFYAFQKINEHNAGILDGTDIGANDSKGTIARKVLSDYGQTALDALTGGVATEVPEAVSGFIPNAIRVAGNVNKTGLIGAGMNTLATAHDTTNPADLLKSAGTGYIGGALMGGASEAIPAAVHGAAHVPQAVSDSANTAAEHVTGMKADQILNDNEVGTLRDYADWQMGDRQNISPGDYNTLDKRARLAAQQAGIDVLHGSPEEIGQRVQEYVSKRYQFLNARNSIMQGGYARFPFPETGEQEIDPIANEYAAEKTPQEIVQEHADMLQSMDKSAKGGVMLEHNGQPGAPSYTRTSEHSPFYRQYFKENGKAPSKTAYLDQATKELEDGKGDMLDPGEVQAYQLAKQRDAENNALANNPTPEQKHESYYYGPNKNEPVVPPIDRTRLTGLALDTPNRVLASPEDIGHALGMTDEQIQEAGKQPGLNDRPEVTPLQSDQAEQLNMPRKLTSGEKQALIDTQENQQTTNKVGLNVPKGNVRGAIAQATGIAKERISRFQKADDLASKLDSHDQSLLSERADSSVTETPHDKTQFDKAAKAYEDAFDYSLAADRAGGGSTLRYGNGKYSPLYLKATEAEMDKMGINPEDRITNGKYRGFRDNTRQYRSYTQAKSKGLQPLFSSPLEDARHYALSGNAPVQQHLLYQALKQAAPHDVADIGTGVDANGKAFTQAAGKLPFNASDAVQKNLQAFKDVWEPDSKLGRGAIKIGTKANSLAKQSVFLLTPFHYANETLRFMGSTLGTGHAITGIRGLGEALFTQPGGYNKVIDMAGKDGTMDWIRKSGTPFVETAKDSITDRQTGIKNIGRKISPSRFTNRKLTEFGNALTISLARAAKAHGIDPTSPLGTALGKEYGQVIGRINTEMAGHNPTFERVVSMGALAPHWTRTSFGLIKDAVTESSPKNLKGSHGMGLYTPGDVARGSVIGTRAIGAAFAIIGSMVASGKLPNMQQLFNESGFNPNNPVPNIESPNQKNKKGEHQDWDIPTDPAGLATMLATDPQHFASSRYSPFISTAVDLATNKNWNGNPMYDTNQPNWPVQAAESGAQNLLPISLQNATDPNVSVKQGFIQDIGGRLKTDPNDPQAQANKNYYNQLSQAANNIKQSGPNGQYWAQQFNNLHPANTTDVNGNKYPTPFNPSSADQKYGAYIDGSSGTPKLSPVFTEDQKLNNATQSYPGSPLYKLNGTGTSADGSQAPQALVALEYGHLQDPAAKSVLMNANGGQNGWLAKYESDLGSYSQNYQQNLTDYFKGLGWTPDAINQYWQKHPSTPDPVAQVTFDKPTTDLINQYYNLSASGDSTAASQFFSKNASVLSPAFDQLAQHANALRTAKGELDTQGYPAEPDHVKQVLASMPQGSDSASKKARGQLINANPDVNQYLANIALYESLDKGSEFKYVNPADPNATEGQNLDNGSKDAQTYLKDTRSLGMYDIGNNPTTGQDEFMQNGGFSAGSAPSSGGLAKKKTPFFIKKRPAKVKPFYAKKVHKVFLNKGKPVKLASHTSKIHNGAIKMGKRAPLKIGAKTA